MAKAGVIGWPVGHSLSPKLHRYWLDTHRLQGEYVALAVEPERLAATVRSLPEQGFLGFNVTAPHKKAILPLLDGVDETARAVGAVNTVTIAGGKLKGSNTDVYGVAASLEREKLPASNKAVVLGAGGAARAAVKALQGMGFAEIYLLNRTLAKAEALAKHLAGKITVRPWGDCLQALAGADLLINATSLGMEGKVPLVIDLALLPVSAAVMDMVYAPLETPLLAQAKARGNIAIDGLAMLMHQAVPAFEAWFGVRPEVNEKTREHLLHGQ